MNGTFTSYIYLTKEPLPYRNVIFNVKDSITGIPIVDATVEVSDTIKTTDANGEVVFMLQDGNYEYTAEATGYISIYSQPFIIDGDDTLSISMEEEIPPYRIVTFSVKDNVNNLPIASVAITVGDTTEITDTNGEIIFMLQDGNYEYTAEAAGYVSMFNQDFIVNLLLMVSPLLFLQNK